MVEVARAHGYASQSYFANLLRVYSLKIEINLTETVRAGMVQMDYAAPKLAENLEILA